MKTFTTALVTTVSLLLTPAIGSEKSGDKDNQLEKEHTIPAEGETKMLSSHSTIAEFVGLKEHRCMGMTAECPDNCGHSGSLAVFEIISYLDYQKPGKYGDPKAEKFQLLVVDNHGNAKIDKEILKKITELKEGDTVTLKWRHDYVTRNRASFPVRTITELTPEVCDECGK